jgi:hypothetical protein
MAHATRSQSNQSSSSALVPYHTAHHGCVTGPDGRFDHFLRQPDSSHQQGGYWRFQSYNDDRRAHARGFASPEDVLLEAENGGERYDDIILRWVRGMGDTSYHMATAGTAAQHLQAIYAIRDVLKITRSSRRQIPVYPRSEDPRVKQFWDDVRSAQQQAGIDPALTSPGQPTPSLITPRSEQENTPQSNALPQQVQVPPEGRVTRARSAQVARTTPSGRATPLQHSPATPLRPTQLSGISPLNWQAKSQVQLPQAAPLSASWPSSRLPGIIPNRGQDVGRIPRTIRTPGSRPQSESRPASGQSVSQHHGLDVGRATRTIPPRTTPAPSRPGSPSQARSAPGQGLSQHNWVHQPSHSSTPYTPYDTSSPLQSQQQVSPRSPIDPRLANRRPDTPATVFPKAALTSSADKARHGGSLGTSTSAAAAPHGSPTEREFVLTPAQLAVLTPLPEHTTSVADRSGNTPSRNTRPLAPAAASPARQNDSRRPSTPLNRPSIVHGSAANTPTRRPSPTGFSSPVAAPASSPRTGGGTRPVAAPSRPHTPRTAAPTSGTSRRRSGASRNGHSSTVAPPLSSPVRPTQGTPAASPTPVQSAQREVQTVEDPIAPIALTQDELEAQAFGQAVDIFGCMDCGSDLGHKEGCSIGGTYVFSPLQILPHKFIDLKPLSSPTLLDLRSISDAVALFDPTPAKRSHFNAFPTSSREDAQTELEGMANIIRGEASYNEELVGLPDSVMVLLWGLRNHIVKED